ncbi:hypothetical protein ALQ88_200231 [Pseudomonas savastanoi]|nr:hypothetical protein ALQ88_200231 [Pseudomonas savastanoi]
MTACMVRQAMTPFRAEPVTTAFRVRAATIRCSVMLEMTISPAVPASTSCLAVMAGTTWLAARAMTPLSAMQVTTRCMAIQATTNWMAVLATTTSRVAMAPTSIVSAVAGVRTRSITTIRAQGRRMLLSSRQTSFRPISLSRGQALTWSCRLKTLLTESRFLAISRMMVLLPMRWRRFALPMALNGILIRSKPCPLSPPTVMTTSGITPPMTP